jgi:phosphoglycerate dehydrogenase-like enzyme
VNTLALAPFSDSSLAELKSWGNVAYEPWTQTLTLQDPEELGARLEAEQFDTLIVEADFLLEDLFTAAPSLQVAAICRAALNQVDLEAATEQGVVVLHTPGRNAQAVAELVLGHMLALARQIPSASRYVAHGQWEDPTEPYTRFQGRELAGATLGIVGLGQIGKRVARMARAVGMRVLAHDPYVKPGAPGNKGIELAGLDELLAGSDFVSIHVPDTSATAGMIGKQQLSLMKPAAYFVNVTSAAVVDQQALASAMTEDRLAGAALDVYESHPIAPDSPFLGVANVILTPHIGGATIETIERHSAMVVADLRRYAAGVRPKHLANPAVWQSRRRSPIC